MGIILLLTIKFKFNVAKKYNWSETNGLDDHEETFVHLSISSS